MGCECCSTNIYQEIKTDNQISNFKEKEEYFLFPERNIFDNEELLNMNIIDVSLGICFDIIDGALETYKTKLSSDIFNEYISFHPFFYVRLKNKNNIGVIIQYLKIKEKNLDLTHLWEENGVEYLEKKDEDFELEYLNYIKKVSEKDLIINRWLIKYDIYDLGQISLRQFFNKIIPEKGKWLQKYLNTLNHGSIHFCIDAIKNLGIKKDEEEIQLVKERMKKILENQYEYIFEFNALFNAIEGNNIRFKNIN